MVEQQRQLNDNLLRHRRCCPQQPFDDDAAGFSGVVVVEETGTCGHVTTAGRRNCSDYIADATEDSDSGAASMTTSTSSDNGMATNYSLITPRPQDT